MNKKWMFIAVAALGLLISNITFAQSKKEQEVAAAVEQLRKAMVDGDSAMLDNVTLNELSYAHSGGKLEDKKEFIHAIASGKSDFVTIDLTNQTIKVVKNTAIVRHILSAATNDSGKPATVKLGVLTVWVKDKGKWKMFARSAIHV